MKTEKNFYDIISSKFDNQQLPFEEQDWSSMRKMIDDSRAEKRRTMWLVLSLCLLLFSGAAFGVYEWNNNRGAAQHNNSAANNTKNSSSSETLTSATKQAADIGSSTIIADNKTTNKKDNATIPSDNGKSLQNQSNVGVAANIIENSTKINEKKYVTKSHHKKNTSVNNGSEPLESIAENANGGNNSTVKVSERDDPSSGKGTASVVSSGNVTMPSNSIAVKTTGSFTKTSSHKADSATAGDALPQRFSDEPRVFQGKTNIFSVEAGGEYSFGWAVSSDGTMTQGQGLNFIGGFGYEHYMGSKIFLKTGIQFSTFGNMHTGTYNYQHSVGNVIYDSVITTQRLYFLRIPFQAEYFIGPNKKSCVGAGGSVWFLLGNSGYATTYQQPENTPPQNVIQYSKNAPLNGYTKVDFSGQMFYRYMINHKFSVYFIIYSEFTSMREKSFFRGNITDNTRGLQCTFSYNLN